MKRPGRNSHQIYGASHNSELKLNKIGITMFRNWRRGIFTILALWLCSAKATAEPLLVDFMISSGEQRSAWVSIVQRFSHEHPDITVINTEYGQEQYKGEFLTSLKTEKVDLAFWFAGERLRDASEKHLLSPLDDSQVKSLLKHGFSPSTIDATNIDGRVYGFPLSYYPWGFFYRKSLFKSLGIEEPKTWNDFNSACAKMKASNVTPLAIGAKDGWPAAAWFDYLDLRINGMEFHRRLLRGEESFRDPRVRKVLEEWNKLLKKDYFLENTRNQEWDSVLPHLYRMKVGMVLMGAFAAAKFPPDIADDIGFFPFPRYSNEVPVYEDAPLDVLVVPASGQHHQAVRRFLDFMGSSGAMAQLNKAEHTISPQLAGRRDDSVPGARILNAASKITFFFDRDTKAEIVEPAFAAFRQLLHAPYDVDEFIRVMDTQGKP